jgi:uncharacterized iron-regulated membrane protein
MYRGSRIFHRWTGLVASLFLLTLAATGFLLAIKGKVPWMRPPEVSAEAVQSAAAIVELEIVLTAVLALGIPELTSIKDIDRIDYRPKSNIFKVVSKRAYHEVQVDGKTGKVLSVAKRNDQWIEDIHDLSFFHDAGRDWVLPTVSLLLAGLATTGLGLYFTPVVRRWRFRNSHK